MKKFLGIILTLGIVASLVGCGNKTETTTAAKVDTSNIKMGRVEYAAHGTKCFTVAVVAVSGDTIVGASIDDYQFMGKDVAKGVPNSDKDFGLQGYKDPNMVLASKKANAKYYSDLMKEEAKATKPLDESYAAIEKYVTGKTVADLEKTLNDNDAKRMVDAVSGATLQDTKGYVTALVEAAKTAK